MNQIDVTNGIKLTVIARIMKDEINKPSSLKQSVSFHMKKATNDPAITLVEMIMPITAVEAPNLYTR